MSAIFENERVSVDSSDATIVVFHDRKFVAGLFWQPLTSPRKYMDEARDIGKKRRWDIVAIRRGLRIQAGFVSKQAGALKGMYSLAAVLAGQLGDSWIGAFDLGDERYAVVAVHEGSIVPGYDLICGRETALEKLQAGFNLFQYDHESIFAPPDFHFSQFDKDLKELLAPRNLKREYRLKQLTFGLTRNELVILGLFIVGSIGASLGYLQYADNQERLAREERIRLDQARAAELDRVNAIARQKMEVSALEHPWATIPSALEFAQVCDASMNAIPLAIAGWQLQSATCDGKAIAAVFKRRAVGTTNLGFSAEVRNVLGVEAVFADEGKTATAKVEIAKTIPPGGDEDLLPVDVVIQGLAAKLQAADVIFKVTEKNLTPPPAPAVQPGQQPLPPPPMPAWRQHAYEIQGDLAPITYIVAFGVRTGVRLTQISVQVGDDDGTLQWAAKGDIYAKR